MKGPLQQLCKHHQRAAFHLKLSSGKVTKLLISTHGYFRCSTLCCRTGVCSTGVTESGQNRQSCYGCGFCGTSLTEAVRVECLRLTRLPVIHLRVFFLIFIRVVCGVGGPEGTGGRVSDVRHGGERIGHRQLLLCF